MTALAFVKWLPVMVTTVPPVVGPRLGLTDVTAGGVMNVKRSLAVIVEVATPGTTTVTSTLPAASAGAMAVIDVAEFTMKLAAAVAPNMTALALVKSLP